LSLSIWLPSKVVDIKTAKLQGFDINKDKAKRLLK
jgi:hypothetical protein